jgi:hypothetical protein
MFGRQNQILTDFLKKYSKNHRDFIYVYEKSDGIKDLEKFHYYTSEGEFVGIIRTRKQYIDLLKRSRVALYSTPGIDGGEVRTKGYNPVTPKFLEYIACGCHIIARYKKNSDTDFYELEKFSPSINTYGEFEDAMNKARESNIDMQMYSEYLEKHYTSKRADLLKTILKKENIILS